MISTTMHKRDIRMNKILIAVDGSDHAKMALSTASALAKQHNAAVMVLHCVNKETLSGEVRKNIETEYGNELNKRLGSMNLVQSLPDETQYARTLLSHTDAVSQVANAIAGENILKRAISFLQQAGVDNASTSLVNGDAADEIIKAYEKNEIDTIVMGCRGVGKIQGLVFGSVSQSVAHRAKCTVILVK